LTQAVYVDWFRIFVDLERHGYNVSRVAAEIEIPRTTLLGWKNIPGTQPKYPDAIRLIELWADLTGLTVAELPEHSVGIPT
jgi:hypothetical protein